MHITRVYGVRNYETKKNKERRSAVYEIRDKNDFMVTVWDSETSMAINAFLIEMLKPIKANYTSVLPFRDYGTVQAFTDGEDDRFEDYIGLGAGLPRISYCINIFDSLGILEAARQEDFYNQLKWVYEAWENGFQVFTDD